MPCGLRCHRLPLQLRGDVGRRPADCPRWGRLIRAAGKDTLPSTPWGEAGAVAGARDAPLTPAQRAGLLGGGRRPSSLGAGGAAGISGAAAARASARRLPCRKSSPPLLSSRARAPRGRGGAQSPSRLGGALVYPAPCLFPPSPLPSAACTAGAQRCGRVGAPSPAPGLCVLRDSRRGCHRNGGRLCTSPAPVLPRGKHKGCGAPHPPRST